MREQMLKVANKRLKVQIIIAAALAVICIAVCIPTFIGKMKGAIELDSLREGMDFDEYLDLEEYDQLEGKYVSLDVQWVLDTYYTKKQSSSSSYPTNYGYLIYDEESGYMMGIYVTRDESKEVWDDLMDDTYDYLTSATDDEPKPVTIKGTFRKMTGTELSKFKDTAKEWGDEFFNYDYRGITLMYTIDTSSVNGQSSNFVGILEGLAGIFLLWLAGCVIGILTRQPIRKIVKFINKNGINETELDADFASAKLFKNVYVGRKYTYIRTSSNWSMFKNTDLVWAYYYRRTGRYSVSRINAYHYDKSASFINLSRSTAEEILQYYAKILPQIIVGYSADLEKMYNKDYPSFLAQRYTTATLRAEAAESTQGASGSYSDGGSNTSAVQEKNTSIFRESGSYAVRFIRVDSSNLIETIKVVREITGLGLAEAKGIVDNAGVVLKDVSYSAAEEAVSLLKQCGNDAEAVNSVEL